MGGNGLRALDRAAVEQICRNSGRPEGMAVYRGTELRVAAAPLDCAEHVDSAHPAFEGWS